MEVTRGRLQVKEVKTGEAAKKSRFEEVTLNRPPAQPGVSHSGRAGAPKPGH